MKGAEKELEINRQKKNDTNLGGEMSEMRNGWLQVMRLGIEGLSYQNFQILLDTAAEHVKMYLLYHPNPTRVGLFGDSIHPTMRYVQWRPHNVDSVGVIHTYVYLGR